MNLARLSAFCTGHSAAERIISMEDSNDTNGNRTRSTAVPQPTALSCEPRYTVEYHKKFSRHILFSLKIILSPLHKLSVLVSTKKKQTNVPHHFYGRNLFKKWWDVISFPVIQGNSCDIYVRLINSYSEISPYISVSSHGTVLLQKIRSASSTRNTSSFVLWNTRLPVQIIRPYFYKICFNSWWLYVISPL